MGGGKSCGVNHKVYMFEKMFEKKGGVLLCSKKDAGVGAKTLTQLSIVSLIDRHPLLYRE